MLNLLDRIWRKPLVYFALLTAFAAATPRAFAPYYQFWLMPLLFGGLIALTEIKPERRISSAYWFGLIAYTSQFWWIHTALHDVSGLPNAYAVPLTFLLPAFLALFPAIAFWLYGKQRLPRPIAVGVLLPMLWTLTEFARERVFTGFGWGALGYSQIADRSPLAGFAPVAGIHLVTLATAFIGAWLVLITRNRSLVQRIVFALAVCVLLYIANNLRPINYTRPHGLPVTVALAQGNIPQNLKFDPKQLIGTYKRYFNQVASSKAQIVVLPETAFPEFLQRTAPDLIKHFAEQAQQNNSALAVGMPAFTEDGRDYLNTMVNLSRFDPQSPENIQIYAKNHLVPFGEFKPVPQLTEPLYSKMNMPLADFKRGGIGQEPFDMAGQKVAFNICYEDGFGDELIESAKKSTLLANASNMAWYGKSNAMWQHLQLSQARALELGRYMIRATNTGATAIVAPNGSVVKHAKPNIPTVLKGEVYGMIGQTPYMRMGGSWYLFYLLLISSGLLMCYRPRAPRTTTPFTPVPPTTSTPPQQAKKPTIAEEKSERPTSGRPPRRRKRTRSGQGKRKKSKRR
ncbi:MAG: apolipoprotein N-acyltransferase [Conchiformibius sp.]|nr:apolipoprotein N-acyltransferase [Conchiformibius sp.]